MEDFYFLFCNTILRSRLLLFSVDYLFLNFVMLSF